MELHEIILNQLISLERTTPSIDSHFTLILDEDQYLTYDLLCNSWGLEHQGKYPYFFLTGTASTGKSYLLHIIISLLNSKKINHIVIAPTGVAAQNVGGKTIHSELKIRQTHSHYETLAVHDPNTKENLKKLEAIIIEEISMVSSDLFSFISNLFGSIHNNSKLFGGIPVLLVRDLFQLPPINAQYVFHSPVWKRFFPLFLTQPKRQRNDPNFYNLLQELRYNRLSETSKKMIRDKIDTSNLNYDAISSTHLVGIRETAKEINKLICDNLPTNEYGIDSIISKAIDTLNHNLLDTNNNKHLNFNRYTNLPDEVILKEGARVMFLNNKLFDHNICNGTIGVITNIINDHTIEVTFPTTTDIIKLNLQKETTYFDINGNPASRCQFPIQNAFALTIHKTQGLTLPHTTINMDQKIFAEGQVYVAMSRAPTWESINIINFDFTGS